jgi:hypothetical protein
MGTPHKQDRRLTPPGRKRTASGWKLDKTISDVDIHVPLVYVRQKIRAMEFASDRFFMKADDSYLRNEGRIFSFLGGSYD